MAKTRNRSTLVGVLTAFWGAAVGIWVATAQAHDGHENPHAEVLSLGGSITEIVYALGEEHRLVARDTISMYPPQAMELPDVGYVRALSPEGVLSVAPKLIIAEEGAGPPEALDVLKEAGVGLISVPHGWDGAGIAAKVRIVGEALDVSDKAEVLAQDVEAQVAEAQNKVRADAHDAPKKVLFILSAQGGRIMASGQGTGADAIITLAGGENAVQGFEGYKPLSDEAVTEAAPDVILMMDRGGDHSIADDVLFAMPALITTPAAKEGKVVRMNGLLMLGFGPRTAQAITDLNTALYGE